MLGFLFSGVRYNPFQSAQKLGNFLGNFSELPSEAKIMVASPPRKPLTHARQAETAKPEAKPYKLNAGDGLFLEVMPSESKH